MSDENMEKNFPEDIENEEVIPETETTSSETVSDGNWQWDAAVPETSTDNISFDDLVNVNETAEEKTEEAAEEIEEAVEEIADSTAEESAEEENEPEEAESDDDGLCIVCGNKRLDSPSDLYCNECREKFLRTDYGVGHIILAFVMVIVAAIGYFVCASNVSVASKLSKAESYISEKRYDDAVNTCSEITDDISKVNSGVNAVFSSANPNFSAVDWFNEGTKTTSVILNSYADVVTTNGNEHENFVYAVESAFTDKDGKFDYSALEKKGNEKIKKVYDFSKGLSDASVSYMEGMQDFVSYADDSSLVMDYDKAMAYIDSLDAKTQPEKCMADYCRFIAAFYAEKDIDTVAGCFDSLFKNAGDLEYIFWQTYMDVCYQKEAYDKLLPIAEKSIERNTNDVTAYNYMIKGYIFKEDFGTADKVCETMKKNNPDGLDYYSLKATVLRRQGKFDEVVKLCTEGNKKGQDAEIYRQQAIAYMLLDNKESALEAIKQAYDIEIQLASAGGEYVSLEVLNTAALMTKLCGDEETHKEISELFENQGVSFEKSVLDCIKGETTFEEIFMEGKGEV